jgi:hypothetical protein
VISYLQPHFPKKLVGRGTDEGHLIILQISIQYFPSIPNVGKFITPNVTIANIWLLLWAVCISERSWVGAAALQIGLFHVLVLRTAKWTTSGVLTNICQKPLTYNRANSGTISNFFKLPLKSQGLQQSSLLKVKSLYLEIFLVLPHPNTFFYHSISEHFITSSIHSKHWRIFSNCILILLKSHIVVALFVSTHALTTTADVVVCYLKSSLQIDWTEAKHVCYLF